MPSFNNLSGFLWRLPTELKHDILDLVAMSTRTNTVPIRDPARDPSIAPRNGKSPFLGLPCELRRQIFSYLLPSKDKIIEPSNPTVPADGAASNLLTGNHVTRPTPEDSPRQTRAQSSLKVCDALVLNEAIAREILVMLYEERTFAVNLYEGISDGGIYFLNSGLQRLQYREHFTQVRFKRFQGPDDPFGFSRVKRILIRVFPAKESALEKKTSRHDAMHTHFMLRALVQLLQEDVAGFGLNRLQVRFVEPNNSQWRPRPWQNTTNAFPRGSSIHGISNVEVILRGLLDLRRVQEAVVELPPGLLRDRGLSDFVTRFQAVVTDKVQHVAMDDELACKIEGARDMLDDWISTMSCSKAARDMPAMADSEFESGADVDTDAQFPDEDDFYDLPWLTSGGAAGAETPVLRDAYERRSTTAHEPGSDNESSSDNDIDVGDVFDRMSGRFSTSSLRPQRQRLRSLPTEPDAFKHDCRDRPTHNTATPLSTRPSALRRAKDTTGTRGSGFPYPNSNAAIGSARDAARARIRSLWLGRRNDIRMQVRGDDDVVMVEDGGDEVRGVGPSAAASSSPTTAGHGRRAPEGMASGLGGDGFALFRDAQDTDEEGDM